MARTDTLGNFLTDVANAIKEKKGTTDTIPASNFDTEIANLPSGGGDISEYINTNPTSITGATSSAGWIFNGYILEYPDLVIGDGVTSINYLFSEWKGTKLPKVIFNNNVTNCSYMYNNCTSLTEIDVSGMDTSNVKDVRSMFYYISKVTDLDLSYLDFSSVIDARSFIRTSSLKNLVSFKNYGKGFTQKTNGYTQYTLAFSQCTALTHDSLMSIIENLYDLNLTYDVANGGTLYTQNLQLGSTNLAKLTEEEIAIATNKGWVVS